MFLSHQSKQRQSEFAHLVREEGPLLVLLARRLAGNQDADDVLQGALLAAWKGFSSRADLRNPRSWLAQFVAHEAQNLLRRRHRRRDTMDVSEEEPSTSVEDVFAALQAEFAGRSHAASPQEVLDCVDGDLRAALLALSEPERVTFLMRAILDLSYRELAEMLTVPVGTVMSRLSRAREKLRTQILTGKAGCSSTTPGEKTDAPDARGQQESTA